MSRTRIRVEENFYQNKINFYLRIETANSISFAQPITINTFPREEVEAVAMNPLLQLEPDDKQCLQELMDDLWHIGIRPTEGKAGDSVVNALKDHLSDMRKIAFSELEIDNG